MRILTFTLLLLLTGLPVYAKEGSLIQITRRFRLTYMEPPPPKDFFIDLGDRDGIKVGDVFEVSRQIPVVNMVTGGTWHLMRVGLGDVKVYLVGESTSVARAEVEIEPSLLPITDYPTFMLGDQVRLKEPLQK